jgi:Dolichyl-phosphate-mannose-protein mannosyltransferase
MGTYVRDVQPHVMSASDERSSDRALWLAEDAARELPNLPLEDALQLVHLYAERGAPKYQKRELEAGGLNQERVLLTSSPRSATAISSAEVLSSGDAVSAGEPRSLAGRRRPWEILAMIGISTLAGWLRLRHLDLIEFKLDEATAVSLARRVLDGDFLTVGLSSSVRAHNPPLFIYLTAVPLALWDDPRAATAFVGMLAVAAVILTYFVLRPRFGPLVALGAAALFATAPWAVLYSRKLWGQSVLPLAAAALLWSMFAVLERARSRAVVFIPILLCVAFQLSFSALALVIPAAALLLYRGREVHWPAFALGVGVAVLLLAPWLYHQVTNGFEDVSLLVSGAPGGGEKPGVFEVVRESVRQVGIGDWGYVVGVSLPGFLTEVGRAWSVGRVASTVAATLFVLGLVTCALCVVRGVSTSRRWPWLELAPSSATRALLLIWLAGAWLAIPAGGRLFPHYLIVTFPVVFGVQALALSDLVGAVRRVRQPATIGAIAVLVAVAAGHTVFTLSFHRFLDGYGAAGGDYGIVYRDKAELASVLRARGLRVADDPVIDFLVAGDMGAPPGAAPLVPVRNAFDNALSLPCAGELRSFGLLSTCLPAP